MYWVFAVHLAEIITDFYMQLDNKTMHHNDNDNGTS